MKFVEVLKDLLLEHGIGIQELSKGTGIDDSVLYDHIHGSIPQIKYAVSIANYFNCSLNYLMGLDEFPNDTEFKNNYDVSFFSDRYDGLLQENNVTHYKLTKLCGLNYSSHYAWRRGATPSMNSLITIANYFGTSIDYLIGRSDKK